ncbi:hypothetical protein COOONC_19109 [Cooperia oncophora]
MSLNFSIDRLVDTAKSEPSSSQEERTAPIAQTLSYFDVLLPHVQVRFMAPFPDLTVNAQMAYANPFLAGLSDAPQSHSRLLVAAMGRTASTSQFFSIRAGSMVVDKVDDCIIVKNRPYGKANTESTF